MSENALNANSIDPKLGKKAMIASGCYMGAGQFFVLKQRVRGILLMLFEAWVLLDIILGLNDIYITSEVYDKCFYDGSVGIAIFFNNILLGFFDFINNLFCSNTIIYGFWGLFTLGNPHPELPVNERDHSIFLMIDGLFTIIICAIFVYFYINSILSAKKSAEKIIKNGKFPTRKEAHNDLSQNAFPIIGVAPSVILIAFFTVIPLLFAMLVAFTNYSSPDHIPPNNLVDWVGFDNFKTMFSSVGAKNGAWLHAFVRVALWTVLWAVFATFSCFFLGFFFAVVLLDKRIAIPKFYRTIFILPYAIPTMLSLFVWANLLNGTMGPINMMLKNFGIPGVKWLSDPNVAKITLILVNMWIGFPYSMILTTSSMTAIPSSMYEAAQIDGANKWQQFKSLTLPMVMYQLKPTLIMQFASNINNFGAVFFLTGGGPTLVSAGENLTISTQAGSTDILISWIYKLTMNSNEYNIASVLSILVFIVLVPFGLYNFLRTKSFKEGEV